MIAAAWFVVLAPLVSGFAVAPPPRVVLPIVWEWDAGHPKCRAVVTEDGKTVQVLIASGRLTIDPLQVVADVPKATFRVREASLIAPGGFSVDTERMCPAAVGKGERVAHSASRVSYPLVVVATRDGKPNGTPLTFVRGPMMIELFLEARPLWLPDLELGVFEPTGYVKP